MLIHNYDSGVGITRNHGIDVLKEYGVEGGNTPEELRVNEEVNNVGSA